MPDRETIEKTLTKERTRLLEWYRSQPADVVNAECTKSEDPDGGMWKAKDHLAHLAHIERAFQGMIERSLSGKKNPVGFSGTNRDEIIAGVHRGNETNVEEHRNDDLETLLTDLEAARADTLSLLDRLTDDQLAQPLPGAPWNDGTVGGVLITNAHHEIQHMTWVKEGLGDSV
jgi:hypothetical protein